MEVAECAAAALGVMLAYYGKHVPLKKLRQTCGVTRNGSNAQKIILAAKQYGLNAKGIYTNSQQCLKRPFPFINPNQIETGSFS